MRADAPLRGGRAAELLLAAADDLRGRVALDVAPERLGIVVGTALGGVEEGERALAERRPGRAAGALYDRPGRTLGGAPRRRGPVLTVSTACASGATALGIGADLLRDGPRGPRRGGGL